MAENANVRADEGENEEDENDDDDDAVVEDGADANNGVQGMNSPIVACLCSVLSVRPFIAYAIFFLKCSHKIN